MNSIPERERVRQLIRMGATLDQARYRLHTGQISQRVYNRYWRLWIWSAYRFSGIAGALQLHHPNPWPRIKRIKRALAALAGKVGAA